MNDRFELVSFEDRQILTVRNDAGIYVVMKPVAEALGLDWSAQRKRIASHPVIAKGMVVTAIPSAGGVQEAVVLELEKFHGWLVTISPDRIADLDKRTVILRYQERAFRVIFEHFHGRLAGRLDLRSVSSHVALQNHALRLTTRLQSLRNRVERRMVHQLLAAACAELGIDTPPLDQLGYDAPTPPDLIHEFWVAFAALEPRGRDLDHSRDPGLLALNLKEVRARFAETGLGLSLDAPVQAALRQSDSPRFVGVKTVNSRVTGGAKACWVFEVPAALL